MTLGLMRNLSQEIKTENEILGRVPRVLQIQCVPLPPTLRFSLADLTCTQVYGRRIYMTLGLMRNLSQEIKTENEILGRVPRVLQIQCVPLPPTLRISLAGLTCTQVCG